jgi:hypothetical protein
MKTKPTAKESGWHVSMISVIIAVITILILGCDRAAEKTNSTLSPPPETDPLAQPKSLQQVGLPVELTRETIPADNPQTPEKIALGQKHSVEIAMTLATT